MKNIINYKKDKFEKYISNADILNKAKEIAHYIDKEYIDEEVLFVGVLNGCIPFMNLILSNSSNPYSYKFIKISSYSGTKSGNISLELGLSQNDIVNRNIVIVEDIIDSGKSIKFINDYFAPYNPKSIKVASLLVKKESIKLCDWYGFKISDKFVIGFGMDLDGSFRYLKDINQKV